MIFVELLLGMPRSSGLFASCDFSHFHQYSFWPLSAYTKNCNQQCGSSSAQSNTEPQRVPPRPQTPSMCTMRIQSKMCTWSFICGLSLTNTWVGCPLSESNTFGIWSGLSAKPLPAVCGASNACTTNRKGYGWLSKCVSDICKPGGPSTSHMF